MVGYRAGGRWVTGAREGQGRRQMGELADRVASGGGLGVNRHAPVAFRAYGGTGDDSLDLPGQDAVDAMGEFSDEDQVSMGCGGRDGPLGGSWPDGGVRLSSMLLAARMPYMG